MMAFQRLLRFLGQRNFNHRDFIAAYQQGQRNFSFSRLKGVNLNDPQVDFNQLSLVGADLRLTTLPENLTKINLWQGNLEGVDLQGTELAGVNLSHANLMGANLTGTNLEGANLSHANLMGANLSLANLSLANLSGANLLGCNCSWADFDGANLSLTLIWFAQMKTANLPWNTVLVWYGAKRK